MNNKLSSLQTAGLKSLRFDSTTIRLLILVAETGSVTHGAAALNIVPAAASRRIKELELQLGVRLFERRPHSMELTELGRSALAHARSLLHAADRIRDDANAFISGSRGIVKIAVSSSAVAQFLPSDIRRCRDLWPDVDIDLIELHSVGVINAVRRGMVDIGIFEKTRGPIGLTTVPYRQDSLALVVYVGHGLENEECVTTDQVLEQDLIGLDEKTSITEALRRQAEIAKVPLKMRIRVASFGSMISMLLQHVGVGVMPINAARTLISSGDLKVIPIADDWAYREFMLCHQEVGILSKATRSLIPLLSPSSPIVNAALPNV